MSTIVFHHGALGDSVLTWPLLRALPACTFVAPSGKARLAAKYLGVTPIDIDTPDLSRLHAPDAPTPSRLRLSASDQIISFVASARDAWATNIRRLAPQARCAFVEPRPNHDLDHHLAEYHRRQLIEQGFDLTPAGAEPRINPDGPVVIHPGSGGVDKCWPAERFERLIEHFNAIGRPVVVLLGEAEAERWSGETLERWQRLHHLVWPRDLVALGQAIAGASVFIGNDSGPTHLAAQLGVPTVALFGPTAPRVWSPIGPAVRVLAPPAPAEMTWLDVQSVADAASH